MLLRMNSTNRIALGIFAIIVIALAAFLIIHTRRSGTPQGAATSTTATSSASTANGTGGSNGAPASGQGYTITPVSVPKGPDPAAPLVFSASIDAATRASMQKQFTAIQAAFAKDPFDFNAWIALGNLRKSAGDSQGAIADWKYMNTMYPANVISYANLADIYVNTLHDYPKAADSYQHALVNDPKQTYLYDNFYQLYADEYPAAGASLEAALKTGIKTDPNNAHLQLLLARYYKSQNRSADAAAEYQTAIATASAQGQTSLAAEIRTEASAQ